MVTIDPDGDPDGHLKQQETKILPFLDRDEKTKLYCQTKHDHDNKNRKRVCSKLKSMVITGSNKDIFVA